LRKKFIIISILFFCFFILINIFYGFFYDDNIDNLLDKLSFRINYYSREILEQCLDYNKTKLPTIISKDDMSIELSNINYEQSSKKLSIDFNFYTNDERNLEKLRFMLRVHDGKKIYYNKSVGDNLFVGNTDYLLYNKNLYFKLSTKGLDSSKLDENTSFNLSDLENGKYKTLSLIFNLGENCNTLDNLYIEFLDLIYKPEYDNCYKIFNYLGELKYKISF